MDPSAVGGYSSEEDRHDGAGGAGPGGYRLLPRLLKGRKSGPVFVTKQKARVPPRAADLDPSGRARLSYQRAEALFSGASGGATLHQLRRSRMTPRTAPGRRC